jgi:putative membrane protein
MFEKKVIVLSVDRDNDLGEKTGVKGPLIGEKNILNAAMELGIADPTESDTNVLFRAIQVFRKLKKDETPCEVVALTGDIDVGVKSDLVLSEQLDTILKKIKTKGVILVTDGREDENILPAIQSKVPVLSIDRIVVQQSESIEETYFILYRYMRQIMEDRKLAGLMLGAPGLVFLLFGTAFLLGKPQIGWFGFLFIIGVYLFVKGFGIDVILKREFSPQRVGFVFYLIAVLFGIVGVWQSYYYLLQFSNLQSIPLVIATILSKIQLVYVAFAIALFGRFLEAYSANKREMLGTLALTFFSAIFSLVIYQSANYILGYISLQILIMYIVVAGALSVIFMRATGKLRLKQITEVGN